jgi:hypothetical protein
MRTDGASLPVREAARVVTQRANPRGTTRCDREVTDAAEIIYVSHAVRGTEQAIDACGPARLGDVCGCDRPGRSGAMGYVERPAPPCGSCARASVLDRLEIRPPARRALLDLHDRRLGVGLSLIQPIC